MKLCKKTIKRTAAANGRTNGLKGIAQIAMKYTTK